MQQETNDSKISVRRVSAIGIRLSQMLTFNRIHILPLLTGPIASLMAFGMLCNESLPPYRDPSEVFDVSIHGEYVLGIAGNRVNLFVDVVNSYDETLEAEAEISGQIQMTLNRDPTFTWTATFGLAELMTTGKYNPTTRVLRVNPGDTLRFRIVWTYMDDSGRDFRTTVFRYFKDMTCNDRCIAEMESFSLKASANIFSRIPEASSPQTAFSFCYVTAYIPPQFCPPIVPCARNSSLPCM
jgi:hypothetical protein